MLPELNGFEVCQMIREKSDVPIIMLTAKGDDMDKILGLEYGADDYVTKPFNILEIKARIKAIIRRTKGRKQEQPAERTIVSGEMRIDLDSRRVFIGDREVNLTAKEFDLLELLITNPNKVFNRENLLNLVWGYDYPGDVRTVDVHVRRLREKIEASPSEPKYIHTNGVLVISSRSKKKFRTVFRSMHVKLLFAMIALAIIPIIFLQSFYINYMMNHIRANRVDLVRNYGAQIAEEMLQTDYLEGGNSDVIDGEIRQFSGLYDGRIIVTNADFDVRMDTYGMLSGKKLVSEAVVQALQNNEQSYYDKASDEIWLTYVIRDDNEDDKSEIRGMILFYMSCKDLTDTYDTITQAITFVVIGIGLVLVFMSLVMARSFTKPFKDMANSINRISDGFFDEEVNLTGFSEVEQISEAFNTMLHRLQELESSRQEFVSNVSHELKTPLTSMKVLADSLNMQTDAPVELYREFMQDIGEEIDRENIIINDLLSLVKMDKTEADLNIASVAINDLLESILKRLKPIASKRNIELVLESYRPVTAECDEVKLTLALSNLVENAIKYNVAGGWVQVTLDADHKFFYVTVDDSGIGIPEEYQDKIFERFYRVDKARSRETGGTGLGLSITKNIIQMHHGAIKVASKEDEGTTFSVRIPLTYIKQ